MGVKKHFLSNLCCKLVHYQHAPEIALEVCYHRCPALRAHGRDPKELQESVCLWMFWSDFSSLLPRLLMGATFEDADSD